MTERPLIAVVVFPGSNDDRDAALALERLRSKLADGLRELPKRRATRPTRSSRERRLEGKRQQSECKRARRPPSADD